MQPLKQVDQPLPEVSSLGADWAARVGRAAVECVKLQMWWCPEPNEQEFLHYQVELYIDHVEKCVEQSKADKMLDRLEFPAHVVRFVAYVERALLDGVGVYQYLAMFAD